MKSGGDFEGLIEAARLSVGLTLFHQQATDKDHYGESSFFQVHLLSSMVWLSTASDRLRDLFIAAVFQVNTGQYENAQKDEDDAKQKSERKAVWYSRPFYDAVALSIADDFSKEAFAALPVMADSMFVFRSARNEVVHAVATELGRQQRELARKKKPDVVDENFSYEDIKRHKELADTEYLARVESDVARLVSWYELLIQMSNEVFIVENTLRRKGYVFD